MTSKSSTPTQSVENNTITPKLRTPRKQPHDISGSRIIRLPDVLELLGVSRSTLYNWLDTKSPYYHPDFPKQIKLGARSVGWRLSDITRFIDSLSEVGAE